MSNIINTALNMYASVVFIYKTVYICSLIQISFNTK